MGLLVLLAATTFAAAGDARALASTITVFLLPNQSAGTVTGAGLNCGSGNNTCSVNATDNVQQTVTATPASGWVFSQWDSTLSDRCAGSTNTSCTFTPNNSNELLAADFNPVLSVVVSGSGTVTSAPAGINCPGTCSKAYSPGTSVTLTAAPASGQTFQSWTNCPNPSGNTCQATMSQPYQVTATFTGQQATTYVLNVAANPAANGKVTGTGGINCGMGATTCQATFTAGTSVTLTETPASGQTFTGWSGTCTGTAQTCTFSMDANKSVTANFSGAATTFTLAVGVTGNGSITGGGFNCRNSCSLQETAGSNVTLTATPDSGWVFDHWTGDCATATTNACTVAMTTNRSVGVVFRQTATQFVVLNVTVNGRGSVSIADASTGAALDRCDGGSANTSRSVCTFPYAFGRAVKLTATPATGGAPTRFVTWSGACSGAGSATTCALTLTGDRSAGATFLSEAALAARSNGSPLHTIKNNTCYVTIRFSSNVAASARLRIAAGTSTVKTLTFAARAGNQTFGQIPLPSGRDYALTLTLDDGNGNSSTLHWIASCGGFTPPGPAVQPFRLTQGRASLFAAGGGVGVLLHFNSNRAATMRMRLFFGSSLLSDFTFSPHPGSIAVGPFVFNRAGTYRFELTATDHFGHRLGLRWLVPIG